MTPIRSIVFPFPGPALIRSSRVVSPSLQSMKSRWLQVRQQSIFAAFDTFHVSHRVSKEQVLQAFVVFLLLSDVPLQRCLLPEAAVDIMKKLRILLIMVYDLLGIVHIRVLKNSILSGLNIL